MDNGNRYVGLDVHRDTISVAVLDSRGKQILDKVIPTSAAAVLELVSLLRGTLHVAFEEGTSADWLYGLLQHVVAQVLVCDPRKIDRHGNKSDRIDARELADLLRCGRLSPVYHQDCGLRTPAGTGPQLSHSHPRSDPGDEPHQGPVSQLGHPLCRQVLLWSATKRVMAVPVASCRRAMRAGLYYQQMDSVLALRQQARQQLLREGRKHPAFPLLRQLRYIGPIRAVLLIVFIQTPHRFRTKRQLWAYCGLALATRDSGEYRFVAGQLQRKRRSPTVLGLNRNHHPLLKYVLKSVAARACTGAGPIHDFAQTLLDQGMRPEMVRLTVARKIAAIVLVLWKKGVAFDPQYLKPQAA